MNNQLYQIKQKSYNRVKTAREIPKLKFKHYDSALRMNDMIGLIFEEFQHGKISFIPILRVLRY